MASPELPRRGLLAGGAGLLAALAGCRSVSRYEFRADPVAWPAADRAGTGYRRRLRTTVATTHDATVGGVDARVTLRSRLAVYAAGDPSTPRPAVGVLSTPAASVDGRRYNPLARLSLAALLDSERGRGFLERVGLADVGHRRAALAWARPPRPVATREATCLGRPARLRSYAGVLAGEPRSVAYWHLLRVEAASVVLAAAVHGRDVARPAPLVGPEGYLEHAAVDAAAGLLAGVCGALRYGQAP